MLNTSLDKGVLNINLSGELDHSKAPRLRTEIDEVLDNNRYSSVIFDLNSLTFMDSTGVGLLMGRYKKIKNKNITIFIRNSSKYIDKVLLVSGIYNIIPKVN